jgi:hypothetical protein
MWRRAAFSAVRLTRGGPIRSSCGLTVKNAAFGDPPFDTIIVGVPFLGLSVRPLNARLGNRVGLVAPVFRLPHASPWRQAACAS